MKWAVQLVGEDRNLEMAAPCFQGDELRIVKRDFWYLESIELNKCQNSTEAWAVAEELLKLVHCVGYLFVRFSRSFELGFTQPYDDQGTPLKRGLRATATLNVVSSKGIEQLSEVREASSRGADVVSLARRDPDVQAGFSLLGDRDISWHQIYDIIEFIGPAHIVKKKWASKNELRILKQTANHFRHLGRPMKNPLPANPPTIHQCRNVALDFFRRWVLERL